MKQFENDEVNESDFIKKLDKLKNEISKIEIQLEDTKNEDFDPQKPSISMGEIKNALADFNVFLDLVNPMEKEVLINSLIKKIDLNDKKELKQIELHVFNQNITIL
jgi:predicted component of type VI protein secretion system